MAQPHHIAVVDDHREIRDLVGKYLQKEGYRVSLAESGSALRRILDTGAPDLVVLDIMMPGEDGLTICRDLRARSGPDVPVIFLTARSDEMDRVLGLELGADDYLVKPFSSRELLARIKAVLRRVHTLPPQRAARLAGHVRFDRWMLDFGRRELQGDDGVGVPLSTAEFRLLKVLVDHPGLVLSRDQLLDLTVGREADPFDRSIDNQISRLRRKVERDPKSPTIIQTHRGGGYSFTPEVYPA
ncbi:response regulator [Pelagovum pacificum]|uniref:Regulatory protein VirG n=1 Tax=Pelagovum pacificum TaxID=2588711 RepID=A0A5C5GDD5_9RHOB|nr:response regulator [Pelagovum pacificum]QQA41175.1 response regulator [Pelagovum pacificum]TNY32017.1 response regulator [Pelagovum pacificum]